MIFIFYRLLRIISIIAVLAAIIGLYSYFTVDTANYGEAYFPLLLAIITHGLALGFSIANLSKYLFYGSLSLTVIYALIYFTQSLALIKPYPASPYTDLGSLIFISVLTVIFYFLYRSKKD